MNQISNKSKKKKIKNKSFTSHFHSMSLLISQQQEEHVMYNFQFCVMKQFYLVFCWCSHIHVHNTIYYQKKKTTFKYLQQLKMSDKMRSIFRFYIQIVHNILSQSEKKNKYNDSSFLAVKQLGMYDFFFYMQYKKSSLQCSS